MPSPALSAWGRRASNGPSRAARPRRDCGPEGSGDFFAAVDRRSIAARGLCPQDIRLLEVGGPAHEEPVFGIAALGVGLRNEAWIAYWDRGSAGRPPVRQPDESPCAVDGRGAPSHARGSRCSASIRRKCTSITSCGKYAANDRQTAGCPRTPGHRRDRPKACPMLLSRPQGTGMAGRGLRRVPAAIRPDWRKMARTFCRRRVGQFLPGCRQAGELGGRWPRAILPCQRKTSAATLPLSRSPSSDAANDSACLWTSLNSSS